MLENFLLLYFFIHLSGPSISLLIYISSHSLYSLFPLQSPLFDRLSLPPTLTKPRLEQISLFEVASAMDLAMSFSIACRRSRHVVLHSSPLILRVVIHSSPPTRSIALHATHHLNLLSIVLHEGVRFGMGFEIWKCGGLWGSV